MFKNFDWLTTKLQKFHLCTLPSLQKSARRRLFVNVKIPKLARAVDQSATIWQNINTTGSGVLGVSRTLSNKLFGSVSCAIAIFHVCVSSQTVSKPIRWPKKYGECDANLVPYVLKSIKFTDAGDYGRN